MSDGIGRLGIYVRDVSCSGVRHRLAPKAGDFSGLFRGPINNPIALKSFPKDRWRGGTSTEWSDVGSLRPELSAAIHDSTISPIRTDWLLPTLDKHRSSPLGTVG